MGFISHLLKLYEQAILIFMRVTRFFLSSLLIYQLQRYNYFPISCKKNVKKYFTSKIIYKIFYIAHQSKEGKDI
jgi:hypothetical protein